MIDLTGLREDVERQVRQLEAELAAAQAKIAGNAELIGKFVKAAADAEAEAAALRALLLRATRWVRGIDSTANDVELSQLKRDLDAAIDAARKEGV